MSSASYQIAVNQVQEEIIVNRSRFICYLAPCTSAQALKSFVKELQLIHPQASHHCYAFVAGKPDDSQKYGFSDDGEPSGTAGRPMLAVLQGSQVGQVCAVVVRYFGGTKLGTGGLQRAYGASVRQALTLLQTKTKIPMVHKALACQYTQVDDVIRLINQFDGQILKQEFAVDVQLTLSLPKEKLALAEKHLTTLSCGKLTLQTID